MSVFLDVTKIWIWKNHAKPRISGVPFTVFFCYLWFDSWVIRRVSLLNSATRPGILKMKETLHVYYVMLCTFNYFESITIQNESLR